MASGCGGSSESSPRRAGHRIRSIPSPLPPRSSGAKAWTSSTSHPRDGAPRPRAPRPPTSESSNQPTSCCCSATASSPSSRRPPGAAPRSRALDTPGLNRFANDDPHVWLDPMRYELIARRIGEGAQGRRASVQRFVARLEALDYQYRPGLANCARDDIVTSHEAFGYLAQRYRLNQIPITGLSPEAEPSPKDLSRVVDLVRRTQATTVFSETLVSPRIAKSVASETGRASRARPDRRPRALGGREGRGFSRSCDRTSLLCAPRSDAASCRAAPRLFAYAGGPQGPARRRPRGRHRRVRRHRRPERRRQTTLLRVAVGLEHAVEGEALIFGEPATQLGRAGGGRLPRAACPARHRPRATVREVVESGRVSRGVLGPSGAVIACSSTRQSSGSASRTRPGRS